MKRACFALMLFGVAPAFGQPQPSPTPQMVVGIAQSPPGTYNSIVIIPPVYTGQGVMSVTTTSHPVSSGNITNAPNSSAFPSGSLPTGTLRIKNQISSVGNLDVCQRGGSATASNCELLGVGESRVFALSTFATNPPTLYCTATNGCSAEIEW